MPEDKDFDLIRKFLEGDESAFNRLAMLHQKNIYWHARRMLGSHMEADEVTQEVLIVLYQKLKTFKFDSKLSTWIYKITSTRSLNAIRKRDVRRFFSIEDSEALNLKSGNDIVKELDEKEKLEQLNEVLQMLPVKQREVFILKNFDGLTYEEISKITGKSVGGLKANYYHAIKK